MRTDVHDAALKAAAKVAFSLAFLNGCGVPTTSEPASTESALEGKPCCDATLEAAFPNPPGPDSKPVTATKEILACCTAELDTDGFEAKHRAQCCYDLVDESGDGGWPNGPLAGHVACTPWGPPVPPAFDRRTARGVA
jgi:hypothetical protein